jgi:hypothetical protein
MKIRHQVSFIKGQFHFSVPLKKHSGSVDVNTHVVATSQSIFKLIFRENMHEFTFYEQTFCLDVHKGIEL